MRNAAATVSAQGSCVVTWLKRIFYVRREVSALLIRESPVEFDTSIVSETGGKCNRFLQKNMGI